MLNVGAVGIGDVVTDALLITHKMNGSWWFLQTYVIFVVCFSWEKKTFESGWIWIPLLVVSLLVFQPLAALVRPHSECIHYILHHFPLFYAGMVAYRFSVFDRLDNRRWWEKMMLFVVVFVLRLVTGLHILNIGIIMLMIVGLMDIQPYISEKLKRVFAFLGVMSMNMWLIHQFFIDYSWHCSNPLLDLAQLYVVSLVVSWLLTVVYRKLEGAVCRRAK